MPATDPHTAHTHTQIKHLMESLLLTGETDADEREAQLSFLATLHVQRHSLPARAKAAQNQPSDRADPRRSP